MKLVTWLLTPFMLALVLMFWGAYELARGKKRKGWCIFISAWVWLWVWSSPWFYFYFGGALEEAYPAVAVETLPQADALVVLGGSMAVANHWTVYPELYMGADRGWQAARCYHAGKTPFIIFSGISEGPAMKQFLIDLGVPAEKIIVESESQNTYENGVFTQRILREKKVRKVLLVTSSWHLRRSVLTFQQLGIDVIPVGCDYEAGSLRSRHTPSQISTYLPAAEILMRNTYSLKEYLGYWAYKSYLKVFQVKPSRTRQEQPKQINQGAETNG